MNQEGHLPSHSYIELVNEGINARLVACQILGLLNHGLND
jgi:hypothetical protein